MKNLSASVRDRLKNYAKAKGDDFQLVLTRYVNERLLYRLCISPYNKKFVLKGATLFTIWTGHPHRSTRDIDLLGYGNSSEKHIRDIFLDILKIDVPDDGVVFDRQSISVYPVIGSVY